VNRHCPIGHGALLVLAITQGAPDAELSFDTRVHRTSPRRGGAANIAQLSSEHKVLIDDLLTPGFLGRYSRFKNLNELLSASDLDPCSLADLDSETRRHWDSFIRLSTTFPNWASMLREAGAEWTIHRMGIVIDA